MEPKQTVRDITWNPLSWWDGLNPVYSREEVAEINEDLRRRAPTPAPAPVPTPKPEPTPRAESPVIPTREELLAKQRARHAADPNISNHKEALIAAGVLNADGSIAPSPTPAPTPAPAPAPTSEPNWVDWHQKDNDLGNKNIDEVKSYFASQSEGLGKWAEANPALAWRAYQKQQGSIGSLVEEAELSPWSQQLVENLSTGNFGNPDSFKEFDISKYNSEVPYSFDDVPTETFNKTDLNLKYPGLFNSAYRPVI